MVEHWLLFCVSKGENNMTDFKEKILEILAKSVNGQLKEVEYAISNSESGAKGKVIQTVSFSFEVDEGTK